MGIESLKIIMDDPDGIYFPGQMVSGTVAISNQNNKIIKGIYLECQGYAKFHYNELNSETYYSAEESYLDLKIPLMTGEGERRFELVCGLHQFPFSFLLPQKIPPTFQTEMLSKFGYGYVHYSVKVILKRSSKQTNCETTCQMLPFGNALKPAWKPNYECSLPIIVNTIFDLNTFPKAMMPIEAVKTKNIFGLLCCQSGSITVRVWLDRAGYVPGEIIILHVEVDNQSRTALLGSCVNFVESVDFHTHDKSRTYERVISEQKRRDFPDTTQSFAIVVPQVTPSSLQYCDIIDVSYKIEYALIDSETLSNKLVVPIDVLIGNVPLRRNPPDQGVAISSS